MYHFHLIYQYPTPDIRITIKHATSSAFLIKLIAQIQVVWLLSGFEVLTDILMTLDLLATSRNVSLTENESPCFIRYLFCLHKVKPACSSFWPSV